MADMLRTGAAYLANVLKESASSSVIYKRNTQTQTVQATIGKSVFESADTSGVTEVWESRDYLIKLSDLPFGEPVRGDVITETVASQSQSYEVCSPQGIPVFSHGDAFAEIVRVHTKRV